jgi:uncharacterized C2H2 Zn-finger protein
MSREVVIVSRCDTCREPATQTFVVGAISGEAQPMLHLIDVCELHAGPLIELEGAWSKLAPWGAQRAPEARRGRVPANPDDPASLNCEICGQLLKTSTSLANHVWTQHVKRVRITSGLTCPDCGQTFRSGAATGMHRARTHGFDVLAEAYAEARKAGK